MPDERLMTIFREAADEAAAIYGLGKDSVEVNWVENESYSGVFFSVSRGDFTPTCSISDVMLEAMAQGSNAAVRQRTMSLFASLMDHVRQWEDRVRGATP